MIFTPDLQLEFIEMEVLEQFNNWSEEEEELEENSEEVEEEIEFPLPF